MAKLNLTPEQAQVVTDRGGDLLVSAAAGSGKTRVLVERLFRYVTEEGRNVDDFLIITYTRAAAAELRGRIAEDLARRLGADPGNAHLQRQIYRIYRADIKTVDAFCAALLRENIHLVETGCEYSLTADFRVLDEGDAVLIRERVIAQVLEEFYRRQEEGADPGARQLADTFGFGRDDRDLADLVNQMSLKLQSHTYPMRWLEETEAWWQDLPMDFDETPYAHLLLGWLRDKCLHWSETLRSAAEEMAWDSAVEKGYAAPFRRRAEELEELARRCEQGWDALHGAALDSIRLGGVRKAEDEGFKIRMKTLWDLSKEELKKALALFDVPASDALEDLRTAAPAMCALLRLTKAFELAYRREKTRRNVADFSDQEHYAIQLLVGEGGSPTELCRRLGARYAEVMVDEYQDTNEVQNSIFEALTADTGRLFTVGDVKQSIYRFRLADPTIFLKKYQAYPHWTEAADGEARKILLSKNFRSRREVLAAANFVFENILSQEMGEMAYGPEERLYPGMDEDPAHPDPAVEFHLLTLPTVGQGERGVDTHRLEANFIAQKIRSMLAEGFPVREGEGSRPCVPGDFAVLMRSPGANLGKYVEALRRQGIPCDVQESEDFFSAMEVAVTFHLLSVIDNPRQDVALVSVLRSPVFGFTPDRLAQIRAGCRRGDFYTALSAAAERGEEDCKTFLEKIAALRREAGDLPVHSLLWRLYDALHIPAVFGAMAGGEQRQENLVALCDCARTFEESGYRGLFAFVSHLRELMTTGRQPAVGSHQEGDGVHLMTIHKSKGLEFPIVLLADLNKSFNRMDLVAPVLVHPKYGLGPRGIDLERRLVYPTVARTAIERAMIRESRSEEMRVLYVAMTRPKEKLILVDTLRGPEGHLGKLIAKTGTPVPPNVVEGAASLGDWVLLTLLTRPEAGPLWGLAGMEPGTAVPTDEYPWHVLVHDGMEYRYLVPRDRGQIRAAEEEAAFDPGLLDFVYPHAAAAALPTKLTATQLKGREKDLEVAEGAALPPQAGTFSAPSFLRGEKEPDAAARGTAVHHLMEHLDLRGGSAEEQIASLVAAGRLTPEEGREIDPARIDRFLASPLAEEMRRSSHIWREYTFSLLVPAEEYLGREAEGEELLLQGVADCFYETKDGLVVVDFKTDRVYGEEQERRTERYRPQVEAYAAALSRIFQRPVCRKILYYFHTNSAAEW